MPLLSSPGIGSGIDVRSIVEKLMSVEQQPLVKLGTRVVELKTQLSAYGSLKSSVSAFRDAIDKLADLSKFKVFTANSSDEDVLAASASSTAAKGVFNVQVQRIAENHRLAAGNTFADSGTTEIGTTGDTMTLKVGANAFTIESGGKTLAGIRDAINSASDNTGVTASILKDDVGFRLSLAANDTGSTHALDVSYSTGNPFAFQTLNADRDSSGGFTAVDLDASVKLEGQFTITSSSNTLSETVQGVTMTLKKAGTASLSVDRDTGSVEASVQAMVKAYSGLVSTMSKMRGQALKSDSAALSGIESQLRAVMNQQVGGGSSFNNAFEVGISTQKDGTLTLDNKILSSAITRDFDGIAKLFADPDNGLATRLRTLADSFLQTGAVLDGRTQGLDSQIKIEESKKAALEQRLTLVEARLTSQYNTLDSVVSRLSSTGNLLTQQLATLTNNRSR